MMPVVVPIRRGAARRIGLHRPPVTWAAIVAIERRMRRDVAYPVPPYPHNWRF